MPYTIPTQMFNQVFRQTTKKPLAHTPHQTQNQLQSRYNYSLDDLEDDPQYVQTAERFLKGVGEDDTMVDDLYEYFRDADYNIARGVNRAFKTLPNLTAQQKKDYAYLRERFEKADTGGFKQYLNATVDIGLDVLSDPSAILSALLVPWTGGGSLATRQALAQTTKMGLKRIGKSFVKSPTADPHYVGVLKAFDPLAAVPTKEAQRKAVQNFYRSQAKTYGKLGAAEGAYWSGMDTWLRQERDDVDGIDLRQGLNGYEIAGMAGAGAVLGGLLGAGITKGAQHWSVETQNTLRRFSDERQLNDSDFIYKAKKAKDTVIANTIGKPVTRFMTKSQDSKSLRELLQLLRYDTFKGVDKRFLGQSYNEELHDIQGKYHVAFEDALRPLLKSGRFWNQYTVSKEDQNILLNLMRSKDWPEEVPEATEVHKGVARALRGAVDQVLDDSKKVGIYRDKLRRGPNDWMPRRWLWDAVDQDRDELAEIMVNSDAIFLSDEILKDYLKPEARNQYKLLQTKFKKFEKVLGEKDFAEGEGWTARELADLRASGKTFEVYQRIQDDMKVIINNSDNYFPEKTGDGLYQEKIVAAHGLIDEMLNKKNLWHEIDSETIGTMSPSSFSPRSLWMLKDSDIEKFIDDDFNTLMFDYFNNSARLIARKNKFGANVPEFTERWVNPIRQELRQAGKSLTAKESRLLVKTYEYATGLDDQITGGLGTLGDSLKLSQQLAHLPLATVSSLTEIMIPLTRVGMGTYTKGLGNAIKFATGKIHKDTIKQLTTEHGLTREEAYRELHRVYIGLEQAVASKIEGIAGEGIRSPRLRQAQNIFFKTNLLSQWTRTVQLAAFTMGKDLITRDLQTMVKLEGQKSLTKAETRLINKTEQRLLDLGINITFGKKWVKQGSKRYGAEKQRNVQTKLLPWDYFYENDVMQGAARFANEVILDPSKSAVTRPHIQQHPLGTIFFQFLGYPTAFTNTVLKNYMTEIRRNKGTGSAKVLATSLGMTAVAAGFNALRSGGKSLEEEPQQIIADSVQRWGGFGYFEYLRNINRNMEIGGGVLGSTVKAIGGPSVGDLTDTLLYRKGLGEVLATNVPGYSALGMKPEWKAKLKKAGRTIDHETAVRLGWKEPREETSPYTLYSRPYRDYAKPYQNRFKGGEIDLPVSRTSVNPSSRIDRTTGRPYEEQAGDILKNREGFIVGGFVARGLAKYGSRLGSRTLKEEDLVKDVLYPQLKPIIKLIGTDEPVPVQPYLDSGEQVTISASEQARRRAGHVHSSQQKNDMYAKIDEGGSQTEFRQLYNPTEGFRLYATADQQEGSVVKGSSRFFNALEYDGIIPTYIIDLLDDEKFLKVLRAENPRAAKQLNSIRKDYEKMLENLDDIEISHFGRYGPPEEQGTTNFDIRSIREGIAGYYTKAMYDVLEDVGYDAIGYQPSSLVLPALTEKGIKVPLPYRIEKSPTAAAKQETVSMELIDEMDYMEARDFRVQDDLEDEITEIGGFSIEDSYDDAYEAMDRQIARDKQGEYVAPVRTLEYEEPVTRRMRSEDYQKNRAYVLFRREQFMPSGAFENPTKKEIDSVNTMPFESKKNLILHDSVMRNMPTERIRNALDSGEPFHMIEMANNDLPMGKIVTLEEITPQSLNSLKNRLDFTDPRQKAAYDNLENSFNKVRKVPSSKVRKEIEEIEEQLGEVKVTQKGERPFSERVVDPIEEEKWFDPKVSLVSPYEVSARRGDPRYMRIDTIPGRDKQILFSGRNNEVPLYTRDEIINRVKESPNSPFWHHPDNNNIQTEKARMWSLINKDISTPGDNMGEGSLKDKFSTDEVKRYIKTLEQKRIASITYNEKEARRLREVALEKIDERYPQTERNKFKGEARLVDVVMWIPKTGKGKPDFVRHLIREIPDGYVKSTIYKGWLEPKGFDHSKFPTVKDIQDQIIAANKKGNQEEVDRLGTILENDFLSKKMAIIQLDVSSKPEQALRRLSTKKRQSDEPLSPEVERSEAIIRRDIERDLAASKERGINIAGTRVDTGALQLGEFPYTNINYKQEFINFLRDDAVVVRDITPTRLTAALEKWNQTPPSILKIAEDILRGRTTQSRRGKVLNPVIDKATGRRILQSSSSISETALPTMAAAELPRAIPVSIQNNKIFFLDDAGADLYTRSNTLMETSLEGRDPQSFVLKTSGREREVYLVPSEIQVETLGVPRRTTRLTEAAPIEEELTSLGIKPVAKGLGKWEVGGTERSAQRWHDEFMGDKYVGRGRYQAFINDLKKTKTPEEIKDISLQIRSVHLKELEEKLPQLGRITLDKNGSTVKVQNEALLKEAEPTFNRLMVGNHGVYMEFAEPADKGIRIKRRTQYTEWNRGGGQKLYAQFKTVNYANYHPGRWYASIYHYDIGIKPPTLKRDVTKESSKLKKDVEGILKLRRGTGKNLQKVISGGQDGADILFLQQAKLAGINTGGTAPKGYRTQTGNKPQLREEYGLEESRSSGWLQRTEQNVKDSDGTLILVNKVNNITPGSKRTIDFAKKYKKPYLVVSPETDIVSIDNWININNIKILNGAGSRNINNEKASEMITNLFGRIEGGRQRKAEGSLLNKASRLMERGAESFFDIGPEELRGHEIEAANLVNEGIDRGIIPERERVSIQENGRVGKVGDAFDKINHMLLAAKNTDKNLLLQGKEVVQYLTGDREGSVIDLKNNSLGVEIGRTSKNESEIRERILKSFKVQDSLLNAL